MVSMVGERAKQYRAKAQNVRQQAAAEADESRRKLLLNDAELWDRMAAYEEQNPTHGFRSYYPKD
jgi:hypothetical protein